MGFPLPPPHSYVFFGTSLGLPWRLPPLTLIHAVGCIVVRAEMIFVNFLVTLGNDQGKLNSEFHHFLKNEKQFSVRFCMHLRLKILTEIASSPILIGANGTPLQGGRVRGWGGSPLPGSCLTNANPLTLIRLAGCLVAFKIIDGFTLCSWHKLPWKKEDNITVSALNEADKDMSTLFVRYQALRFMWGRG